MSRSMIAILAVLLGGAVLLFGLAKIPSPGTVMSPDARVAATPKGELKTPYADNAAVAAQGHKLFEHFECIGCHGKEGQGRVCPSLRDGVWIYGGSDDTLFRLITLGSGGMYGQGFVRKHAVSAEMPPFGEIIKSDRDIWKIIAWIRAINASSKRQP
jgi:mono/diheme cytochrome c family protein